MGICTKIPAPKGGSGSKGLVNYIVTPELENGLEKCIHSEAQNFISDSLKGQIAEMHALASESVHSKNPIDHWVITFHNDEKPTIEQAREAVSIFVEETKMQGHQLVWGMHDDTDNRHIHIAVNRADPYTGKVKQINNGFDKEAGQHVIALIEHRQGWQSEKGARYTIDTETGRPVMTTAAKVERDNRMKGEYKEPPKPKQQAMDMENQTGTKSALRIAQEKATTILKTAKSWEQLHGELAAVGLTYDRKGSGAIMRVGDVVVKPSDVERNSGLTKLEKKLGAFQSANPTNKEQYNEQREQQRTNIHRDFTSHKQRRPEAQAATLSSLSSLSKLTLVSVCERDSKKLLQADESHKLGARGEDNRRLRRVDDDTKRITEPVKKHQAGWTEYQSIRAEQRTSKSTATAELSKQQADERKQLAAEQKAQRTELFSGNWKGKGVGLNALKSLVATQQAAAKLELSEQHKDQRKDLQAQFKPLPQYKAWKDQPQIVAEQVKPLIDQHIERDKQPQRLSEIVKTLTHTVDRHKHITYQSHGKDIFRDEGKTLAVLDQSSNSLAATLSVAQQKYGNTLTLTGSDAFKQKAVAAAVANNMTVKFSDPALETMRVQMVEQQRQAEREALAQARAAEQQRIEAQRIEATAKLEKEKEADQEKVINTELTPHTAEPQKAIEGIELSSPELPTRNELAELRKAAELYCADTKHAGQPIVESDCKPASRNIGTIAAVSENYFAVAGHDKVIIHPLTEAVKQRLETDGSTTAAQALVPGNKANVSYWSNGRDVAVEITEKRQELQKAKERDYGMGL